MSKRTPFLIVALGFLLISLAFILVKEGKAILLVGSHTWGNLQDYTYDKLPSPLALDFDAYLAFLRQHNHNFFRLWVWENFTRGNQCLFMDPYLDPSHDPGRNDPAGGTPDPYWDPLRDAMGRTRACAQRMNLAAAVPHGELASTGFCLADPGREYVVYLPQGGEVTVDLSGTSGQFKTEWLRPTEGTVIPAEPTAGGSRQTLKTPFPGDAVLYLVSR